MFVEIRSGCDGSPNCFAEMYIGLADGDRYQTNLHLTKDEVKYLRKSLKAAINSRDVKLK